MEYSKCREPILYCCVQSTSCCRKRRERAFDIFYIGEILMVGYQLCVNPTLQGGLKQFREGCVVLKSDHTINKSSPGTPGTPEGQLHGL